MKVRIELVAHTRGSVDVEVDKTQELKLQDIVGPMDLKEFESWLGMDIDTSNVFSKSHMEVDDVEFLPESK
jgi:hypothetical protein